MGGVDTTPDPKREPLLVGGAFRSVGAAVTHTKSFKRRVSSYLVDPDSCNRDGLSTLEAVGLQSEFGPNELLEKERNRFGELVMHFWGPMPIMIWLAVLIEGAQGDLADSLVLLTLLLINGIVGWHEESKAADAIAALKESLAPVCTVRRDGKWQTMPARNLVPGDVVKLVLGAFVPADCMLLEGKPVQIDQSAMTGESLPVTMRDGDTAKMGSTVVGGEAEALVVATGRATFFGQTASMISSVDNQEGHFKKIIWAITLFLLGISFVLVGIILTAMLLDGNTVLETLSICVVLLVASIPIAMQVVCTSTMAIGSHDLAKRHAIVSRLAAIEEIAGMDMLCCDKTGTLTLNRMTLQDCIPFGQTSEKSLLLLAMLGTQWREPPKDAIDAMLFAARREVDRDLDGYAAVDYMPFEPSVKRTESTVHPVGAPQRTFKVTKGAPNVVANLAANASQARPKVEAIVNDYAARGIRCLGVACTDGHGEWDFKGILTFIDPPRGDTKEMIRKAMDLGVGVKMITGDHSAIAKETCQMLDLGTSVLSAPDIEQAGQRLGDLVEGCDGFAGVFPEHKFDIVNALRGSGWITGMTGDGVNDAPALKRADIGIAVQGATDAARAAADIVLTSEGLSVIVEAISLARQIFQRMKNYITYRIACTMQLLVFFFLAVIFVTPRDIMKTDEVPEYFALPVMAIVLITILNDGTIISIAYDHVIPGDHPEKWDLPLVFASSMTLAAVACASSFFMLLLCLYTGEGGPFADWLDTRKLSYNQIRCVMYLKVSISDFLTVFSARTKGFFWERRPGNLLLFAACFSTLVSTLLARYWPFEEMEVISWKWVGAVWAYCIVWWLIQDLVKVLVVAGLMMHNVTEQGQQATDMMRKRASQNVKVQLAKENLAVRGPGAEMTKTQVLAKIHSLESELNMLKDVVSRMK